MSLHVRFPGASRGSATLLFYGAPFLLDESSSSEAARSSRIAGLQRLLMGAPIEDASDAVVGAVMKACRRETFKPRKVGMAQGPKGAAQAVECPICLEAFQTDDEMLRLPCNHAFHVDCLVPWIRSNHDNCPFCRAAIIPKQSRSSAAHAWNPNMSAGYPNASHNRERHTLNNHPWPSRIMNASAGYSNSSRNIRDVPILTGPSRIASNQRQPSRRTSVSDQEPPFPALSPLRHPNRSPPNGFPLSASVINITFSA